ncbi:hypothetical protein ACC785_36740 [Rhizobium ruizarguesonis]
MTTVWLAFPKLKIPARIFTVLPKLVVVPANVAVPPLTVVLPEAA